VSAGGSSLLINLVGMGILLNVSQHAIAGAQVSALNAQASSFTAHLGLES
jgi:hypothetical protein